eukprot:g2487.t1
MMIHGSRSKAATLAITACFLFGYLFSVSSAADRTILAFKRHTKTCDAKDMDINTGTTRVIWAHGSDPSGSNPNYHTDRGSKSVVLSGTVSPTPVEGDAKTLDLLPQKSNSDSSAVAVSDGTTYGWDSRTTYWCRHFSIKDVVGVPTDVDTVKRHVVKVGIINQNPKKLHHILLYQCDSKDVDYNGPCGSVMPSSAQNCNFKKVVAAWAIGGDDISMPAEAGMPMGGADGFINLLMEIHYDNYDGVPFTDQSGLRLFYTPTLRANDVGVMAVGSGGPGISIPPGQAAYDWEFECPAACTNAMPGDMTVTSTFLHAHKVGRKIQLQHVRGGQELDVLADEPYYDFDYQNGVAKNPYVTVKKGDMLKLTCTYNTQARTATTTGGLSSNEEMCLAYLFYYPRHSNFDFCAYGSSNMAACGSNTNIKQNRPLSAFTARDTTCNKPTNPAGASTTPRNGGDVSAFNAADYSHSLFLDANNKVKLHWKEDAANSIMSFALDAPTTGWVGLGFSPNGGMAGADIGLGWLKNGAVSFDDRFATGTSMPVIDSTTADMFDAVVYETMYCSAMTALSGNAASACARAAVGTACTVTGCKAGTTKTAGTTLTLTCTADAGGTSASYVKTGGDDLACSADTDFTRKLDTCDTKDYALKPGATRVLYAYNDQAPAAGAQPAYHSKRGAKSVTLVGKTKNEALPADAKSFDLTVGPNVNIVDGKAYGWDSRTMYWCKQFTIPTELQDGTKRHAVKFDIINNHPGKLHHILLYECHANDNYKGPCSQSGMPKSVSECNFKKVVAVWAIGGEDISLPSLAGIPMGGTDGFKHLLMEIHYDNYDGVPFTDSSGIRVHYTPTLRPNDLGVLAIGSGGPGISIPAGQAAFDYKFTCPAGCTNQLPNDMTVTGTFLHAHKVGRKIQLQQIRDGKEMELLATEPYYDFNFQNTIQKRPYGSVKKGDMLKLTCTYNTLGRAETTKGGQNGDDEMCLAYLFYYPRHAMAICADGAHAGQAGKAYCPD